MRKFIAAIAASVLFAAAPASATTVVVGALANSTSGGAALITGLSFAAGQQFKITSSTNDLWSAGGLPRFSDADGIVLRYANGSDDSGQAPGTQIGTDAFGNWTQGNLSAKFGTLVAVLGPNSFQALGANGVFTSAGGPLLLGYFDSNNGDNFGEITFDITAVPESATWAMMILGIGGIGASMRYRRRAVAKASLATA